MRIRSLTTTSLAAGLAVAIAVPTVAMAAHPFEDVPEGQWFSDAVEWAFDNGLTTGKTETTFNGNDTMTRYEGVTFFDRYNTEIVEPMMQAVNDKVDALEASLIETNQREFETFGFDVQDDEVLSESMTGVAVDTSTTVTVPEGYKGRVLVEFSAESTCFNGSGVFDWCEIDILVDDAEVTQNAEAFDSTDAGSATNQSWEGHSVRAVTGELDAGTYTVTVRAKVSNGNVDFRVDNGLLTADVHLTDDTTIDGFTPVVP